MKRRIINWALISLLAFAFNVEGKAESKLIANQEPNPIVLTKVVQSSSDDARELYSGVMNLTAENLETGGREDGDLHAICFTNIVIPQSAEIKEAYIEFYSYRTGVASGSNIYAEIGNAQTYKTTSKNISLRRYTENRVYWFNWAWKGDVKQTTPNLKNLIDENRLSGWKSGQNIAFKFEGVGYNKGGSVHSFNGRANYRPRLVIKYINNGNGPKIEPPLNDGSVTFASIRDTDAYENYAGRVNYTESSLELGGKEDGNLHAVRFSKVYIPAGAEIKEAYIDFNANGTSSGATTVIHSQIGSAELYSARNISSRTYSQNNVIWTTDAFKTANMMHSTPNLKNIIDENRVRGWKSGQSMAFLFKGLASEGVKVHSFEAFAGYRPRLIIRYENNGVGPVVVPSTVGVQSSVVKAEVDDAYESGVGVMNLTRAHLNMGGHENSENDKHALRFTGLDIPITAEVTEAYIEFYSYGRSMHACVGIVGEVGNAAQYTNTPRNISSRNYSSSKNYWITAQPWINDYTKYVTPNLKNVVEEIRLKGWRTGQSMAFMFDGLSYNNGAVVRSFGGGAKYRPRLIVKYNNNGKGPTLTPSPYGGYSTLTAKGSDDASEVNSGSVDVRTDAMYLGGRGTTKVNAVRFSKVEIPAQAEVVSAYVEFFARSRSSAANVKIQSEIGNPATYVASSRNITSRYYSTNIINWNTTSWVTTDYARYQTPNLKNIIEENRLKGWKSGQAMAFKFEGQSVNGGAHAYAVNGSNYFRPRLVINYLLSGRGPVIGPDGIQVKPTEQPIVQTITIDSEDDIAKDEDSGNVGEVSAMVDDLLSSKEDFNIYPNPVTTTLNIDIDSVDPSATVYIYSMAGKLMMNTKLGTERAVDVSSLPEGVYIIKIIENNNPKSNKAKQFMKQ